MDDFHARISESDCERIFAAAVETGSIQTETKSFLVHELTRMRSKLASLAAAFPAGTLHALAIKANPLVEVLREAVLVGAGLEAASWEEVHLALAAGCPVSRLVFDSPAKTRQEIKESLARGVILNANSFDELDRIDSAIRVCPSQSLIGLRINPAVAAGSIAATSVGHVGSKFGVAVQTERQRIIEYFRRCRWLCGLHVHVGSQGCRLDTLCEAVGVIDDLRREIESKVGRDVQFVDIGGGLPAVYEDGQCSPAPKAYVDALRDRAPALFESSSRLITEFGRTVQASCGVAFTRVEYVRPEQSSVVIHLGADLLMRPVYAPQDWKHEFFVLDPAGRVKRDDPAAVHLQGPLCFAGDVIARGVNLPLVEEGDWIVVRDVGAYTLSLWSRHCNRGIPAVFGYDADYSPPLRLLRAAESPADLVRFWS